MMTLALDNIPDEEMPPACAGGSFHEADRSNGDTERPYQENGPDALAGAAGANQKSENFQSEGYPHRFDKARLLRDTLAALGAAHPAEALAICCGYAEAMGAGSPELDPFQNVRAGAQFWAAIATEAELIEHAIAAHAELGRRAVALNARKRLWVSEWSTFPVEERIAFLRRVDSQSRFHGRSQ